MTNSTARVNELTQHLRKMRLPIMADRLVDLYSDPLTSQRTTLEILEEIVNDEYQSRRHNTIQRYLKQAKLSQPQAHIQDIDYSPSRKINKDTIDQLKTCQFITNHRNVVIQGATGTGKSYITNALCRYVIEEGYTARYMRMYDLLTEMVQADLEDKLENYFKKIMKLDVLVIDDFLLTPTTQDEQKYLMEVFELRSRNRSLIISSQMETGEWHKKLGGGAIADAILDRAISNSYHLHISGDSLRMKGGSTTTD
ncbi:IS21-like element helper ATPase IstB [Aliicoccus persicus]|uniref:DNA replication protein DnaC n=1 Tax=Aliicoccus persicus TaxID=930138 RepID=A0A662Z2E6_9STAP|nr:IS21-like element helper ATPase IstB [Aliicoccus persicus]SEV88627.1 DNA replication protein DnaC [Aliicoccus persicus]SEV97179.1 DNA replication protein DnaC [Aliicoccus persicus]SEW19745.1 DNA replication protein DnaC [Aliicoccus persicus]